MKECLVEIGTDEAQSLLLKALWLSDGVITEGFDKFLCLCRVECLPKELVDRE